MVSFLISLVAISLSGVMMPGPMFAVTVARSYRSWSAGTQMALGHAVVEVPLILIIYFGFARFFQHDVFRLALSLLGGGVLIWLGIDLFRSRRQAISDARDRRYNSFIAGIVMSGLNPFFILWWATIGGMLIMKSLAFGLIGFALLIPVHWLCDLAWLSFVSALVYRTHSLWGKGLQQGIVVGCSLVLVGFGIWFLASGLRLS